jgi:hypothetical protein
MPVGLSTISQPSRGRPRGLRPRRWRWLKARPPPVARPEVARHLRLLERPVDLHGVVECGVRFEVQVGGEFQPHRLRHLPPEEGAGALQRLELRGREVLAEAADEGGHVLEVGGGAHLRHRHVQADEVRVAEIGAREHGGQGVADLLGDAQLPLGGAGGLGAGVPSGHGTRTPAKRMGRGAPLRRRAPETTPEGGAGYAAATVSVS